MAAVLGVELAQSVSRALKVPLANVTFWSDSVDVLCWVKKASRSLKPFVAHRVGSIQTATDPQQWRYVPTKENPADLASRGTTACLLAEASEWWNGPEFLCQSESSWPASPAQLQQSAAAGTETKKSTPTVLQTYATTDPELTPSGWRLDPEHHSDWQWLVRTRAWVSRFVHNCRATADHKLEGELSCEELEDAELAILRATQNQAFPEELRSLRAKKPISSTSKLAAMNPFLDDDGILRSQGRTEYAEWLPYDVRHPILLPRRHHVTTLLVKLHHEKALHSGTNATLAALSAKYWIIAAREAIRDWEKQCKTCQRRKAKAGEQMMAPLPKSRLETPLRAFARVAVDYAGPFETVQGRGRRREKRYLCLFTCLLSRAVHLELAYSLDANAFLNAFARMINRRGRPIEVVSDNGGNFVGAD